MPTSFSFILHEATYTVGSEEELALFFELLHDDTPTASTLHWNILMQLDESLLSIIVSYKGLLACLKQLSTKNQFLLLVKIGDILPSIIGSPEHLASILSGIPEEAQKARLIRHLRRRGFDRIIDSADDLAIILEWLYEDTKVACIEMLGIDRIRTLVRSAQDVATILSFLSSDTKHIIVEVLSLDRIASLAMMTPDDFLILFRALPYTKAKELLEYAPREAFIRLFHDDIQFHRILSGLHEEKERLLLDYLFV